MGWWIWPGWPTAEAWSALWGLGTMLATFGTLVAAVIAGVYAARAARATRQQADAAGEDVALARRALEVAEGEAVAARAEAERATRWAEERRLDGLAPSVFMEALPSSGDSGQGFFLERRNERGVWTEVETTEVFDMDDHRREQFRQIVKIKIHNVSKAPARVDFTVPDNGRLYTSDGVLLDGSGPVWAMPDDLPVFVVWERIVTLAGLVVGEDAQVSGALFRVEAWVRDVGMNVREVYRFRGPITRVETRGPEVSLSPIPAGGWPDRVAYPIERHYDRLDVGDLPGG